MILPLQAGLKSARRWLANEFAGSSDLTIIEQLSAQIPDAMSAIGFEIRLAEGNSSVDFGTVVYAQDSARWRPVLDAGWLHGRRGIGAGDWRTIESFLRQWCDPTSLVHNRVERVFFEFDVHSVVSGATTPCVFVTLDEAGWSRAGASSELAALAIDSLGLLAGERRAREEANLIQGCLDALPPGSMLLHVGAMLARPNRPIRFCGWMPSSLLPGYLRAIHAPVDSLPVQPFCDLDPSPVTFQLTLVGGEVSPRLDIEWHYRRQPRAELRWAAMLGAMVGRGICSTEKRDTVLDWPGLDVAEAEGVDSCLVARAVSHIKVTLKPDSVPIGKAYLTLAPMRSLGLQEERRFP